MREADEANVPVVAVDAVVGEGAEVVSYVGFNNAAGGATAAEYLAGLGTVTEVLELQGALGAYHAQKRGGGFNEAAAGKFEVISRPAEWLAENAQAITADVLTANPNVNGIFTHNDEMIRGVLAGLRQVDRAAPVGADGHIVIVGIDGTPLALDRIRNGEQDATVNQDPFEMGALAVRSAVAALNGGAVEAEQLLPTLVTRKTSRSGAVWGNRTSRRQYLARVLHGPPFINLEIWCACPVSKKIRLVQVGLGGWGWSWMQIVKSAPDWELAAVVDIDEARLRNAADRYGLGEKQLHRSLDSVASTGGLDACLVVVPPKAHAQVTIAAARHGLHCLVEKPLADSIPAAVAMIEAAREANIRLMVNQNYRFRRAARTVRKLVSEGAVGDVGSVNIQFPRPPISVAASAKMDHPLILDMAIHHFDQLRGTVGFEPAVTAKLESSGLV